MFGMGFYELFLLVAIFAIPVWTAIVAKNKGRNPVGWFFIGFIFSLLGLILAYLVPAVGGADYKKCPHCAEIIKAEANVCRFCGRDIRPDEITVS